MFATEAAPAFGITLDAFPAAIIAMSASAAAYNAEIIRAGLQAVHHGQVEAAYAVGMRYGQVVHCIIVPQACASSSRPIERQAGPLLARMLESRRESRTLTIMRETLLPRLISGELRVKDAEQLIERTTA